MIRSHLPFGASFIPASVSVREALASLGLSLRRREHSAPHRPATHRGRPALGAVVAHRLGGGAKPGAYKLVQTVDDKEYVQAHTVALDPDLPNDAIAGEMEDVENEEELEGWEGVIKERVRRDW